MHTINCIHLILYIPLADLKGAGAAVPLNFAIYIRNLPNVPLDDVGRLSYILLEPLSLPPPPPHRHKWIRHSVTHNKILQNVAFCVKIKARALNV